jgi:predicted enzyme related to lactoylglutathione lyase
MPEIALLGIVILAVEDVRRSAEFYEAIFGWNKTVDEWSYIEFVIGENLRLGLYERTSFGLNTGRVPERVDRGELTSAELYFYSAHLENTLKRVRDAGGRELSALGRRAWGDQVAYFADLDGNVLAIAEKHLPEPC